MERVIITTLCYHGTDCRVAAWQSNGKISRICLEDPREERLLGSIHVGKVQKILPDIKGAFVEIENGKTGLVHISEMSNNYVKEVEDYVKEGQTVKVKILGINNKGKIELSMKQAEPNEKPADSFVPKRENFSVSNNYSSKNNFEEMMSKFKKLSEEKMKEFGNKTKFRGVKPSHKGDV